MLDTSAEDDGAIDPIFVRKCMAASDIQHFKLCGLPVPTHLHETQVDGTVIRATTRKLEKGVFDEDQEPKSTGEETKEETKMPTTNSGFTRIPDILSWKCPDSRDMIKDLATRFDTSNADFNSIGHKFAE